MRGDITFRILEAVKDAAVTSTDLFEAFLRAGYGASFKKLNAMTNIVQKERRTRGRKLRKTTSEKQRYYNLLYYLKQAGLISENEKEKGKFFTITKTGRRRLEDYRRFRKEELPLANYHAEKIGKPVIVAFDIPEKDRRKRDWLRLVLRELGLRQIQKSVWLGKTKIPKELIKDLYCLGLGKHVEIFEVGSAGALHHLI
ncbi:MAG: hypothetical protein AAB691_00180 [Patescibacteria group bacterium]